MVPGIVVALNEARDGMDTQSVSFPRVRFRTDSGREVTFESGMARGGKAWAIGDTVPVRYQRDDPQVAEFNSFAALWGPTLAFGVLAAAFLVAGTALLLGVIRP